MLWAAVNIVENIVDLSMTQALQRVVPAASEPDAHAAVRFALLVSVVPATLVALGATLSAQVAPPERRGELQRSLIRSHAAGMGPPVEAEVVRAMMFLRARTLAMGMSGVRLEVVDAIVSLLNAGITPPVYNGSTAVTTGRVRQSRSVKLSGESMP